MNARSLVPAARALDRTRCALCTHVFVDGPPPETRAKMLQTYQIRESGGWCAGKTGTCQRTVIARARDANHFDAAGVVQRKYALHEPGCGGVALEAGGTHVPNSQLTPPPPPAAAAPQRTGGHPPLPAPPRAPTSACSSVSSTDETATCRHRFSVLLLPALGCCCSTHLLLIQGGSTFSPRACASSHACSSMSTCVA